MLSKEQFDPQGRHNLTLPNIQKQKRRLKYTQIQGRKYCPNCKIHKPYHEFSKNVNGKDGLQHVCKDCRRQIRLENKEQFRAAYAKTYSCQDCGRAYHKSENVIIEKNLKLICVFCDYEHDKTAYTENTVQCGHCKKTVPATNQFFVERLNYEEIKIEFYPICKQCLHDILKKATR
jgi:hypothetical protein